MRDDVKEEFIKKLMANFKDGRTGQRISVKEMADYIHVTENHLKAIEKGVVTNLSLTIFVDYCDALGWDYAQTIKYAKESATSKAFDEDTDNLGDYPDSIPDQFDNMTGSMNL